MGKIFPLLVADTSPPCRADETVISAFLYKVFAPSQVQPFPDAQIEIAWNRGADDGPNCAKAFSVFKIADAAKFAAHINNRGHNTYYGVALRSKEWTGGRGADVDVQTVFFNWSDNDDEGGEARLTAFVRDLGITPKFIITTGTKPHRRLQCLFAIKGDITLDKAEAGNAALQQHLQGDNIHEPSRLMRLPGTVTYPRAKKLERGYIVEPVTFIEVKDTKVHDIDAIIALGKKSSSSSSSARSDGFDTEDNVKPPMSEAEILELLKQARTYGKWNNSLLRPLASLVKRNLPDWAIKLIVGQSCYEGYGDPELDAYLQRTRQKFGTPDPDSAKPGGTYKEPAQWPVLDDTALYGIVGEIVRMIEPHSEADPAGLLAQILTICGSVIGPNPYYQVERDRHHVNMFVLLAGDSAKARKGISGGWARDLTKGADEFWASHRCVSGLSSGEGVIDAVRDELKRWNAKECIDEVVDPGVKDKRLLVTETEFASVLAAMLRNGNTLSSVLRNAWDSKKLQTMTKNSPQVATDPHVSIVGHITIEELRERLTRTDMSNGFANRFQLIAVRRSKILPHGGCVDEAEVREVARKLAEAIAFAQRVGRLTMTPEAASHWTEVYGELSEAKPGLLGSVLARAEAHVIRSAMAYALLDKSAKIDVPHLKAALAYWEYCEDSGSYIFGDAIGNPIADEILRALQQSGSEGVKRTEIWNLFANHGSKAAISVALQALERAGKARWERKPTEGRPAEVWYAT
jgi:hypothetical protein